MSQDVRASSHGTWQQLLCLLCSVSERGRKTKKQPKMQIIALLSGLDVENNESVIQSTQTVTKLEFRTSPSPALWAHGSRLRWAAPACEGAPVTPVGGHGEGAAPEPCPRGAGQLNAG